MGLIWGALHRLNKKPDYGLRSRRTRYDSHDGRPVGPRLVRWRRVDRGSHATRAHRRRRRLARRLLLGLGAAAVVFAAIRALWVVDEAALIAAATGFAFLALHFLAHARSVPALWVGTVLHAFVAARAGLAILDLESDHGEIRFLRFPIYYAAFAALLVIQWALFAGARSATALEREEERES